MWRKVQGQAGANRLSKVLPESGPKKWMTEHKNIQIIEVQLMKFLNLPDV